MVNPEHKEVTNREVLRIHAALTALSQRRLADAKSRKKVVTLLRRYFEIPQRIVEDLRKQIIEENPSPESWESESLPVSVAEKRMVEIEDMLAQTQTLDAIPDSLLLTEADMPKPIKGELGDQNEFALADIQHKLGFLYPLDPAEGEE